MKPVANVDSPSPPSSDPGQALVETFGEMLRDGTFRVEDLPRLEAELDEIQDQELAQVRYEPEALLELAEHLDHLLLQSDKSMAEIFRTVSHRLRDFFKSKYVEFLSLGGDGLVYEYITAPAWTLGLVRRLTGLTAVLGLRIPLYDGSIYKELVDAGRPRELITYEDRLRSMKDFLAPSSPRAIELRDRWAAILMRLFGYAYVFQIPLIVQGRFIGYFSFLQKRRFSRRVRADIVLLSNRISHLILLKQREEERRHNVSEGIATLEAVHDRRTGRPTGFRVRSVNPALLTILESSQESLLNQPVQVLGLGDETIESLARVLQTQVPAAFTLPVRPSRTCRVIVSKAESEDLIVVVRDITEQERAEEERRSLRQQILHAQKLESLGVLAGGIAHDFNNLLAAVLINTEMAMADAMAELPASSSVGENLRGIKSATQRAADLTRQMLAYAGQGKMVVRPVRLTEVVNEMVELLRASISKKATLELHLAEQLPPIAADPSQLNQVVLNLVTNASEALDDGAGRITVSTGTRRCDRAYLAETYLDDKLPAGPYVFLEVADTGCGIDEALMGRIFDPFFSTKFTGRGLGLAAVLGIVRSHGGAVRVHSQQGQGTTFTVVFPESARAQETAPAPRAEGAAWHGRGTILLVDDEEMVRKGGRRLLRRLGFEVLEASDGEEAVRVFREEAARIRCVILDLTMPRMNGHEAAREIRQIRDDVPILLSSGYSAQTAMSDDAERLDGFIPKPYELEELRAKLREVLVSTE
jgi:signal transduction histidine kinase